MSSNKRARNYLRSSIALLLSAAALQATAQDSTLEEVIVVGVRGAEQKAVELKRDAASIQDSISAEDIGKLPDVTISDSLQRITGVQIDREGGEGTSVNIRGLPQVGTLLNGEAFLTTSSIVSVQPNFGDIPSQLFAGADVSKSSRASLLNSGITGTIDLRTRRPFDLPKGWTMAAAVQGEHGTISDKYEPELDTLIAFNTGRWGFIFSAAYSNVTRENSTDGMDQYGGELMGETTDSTTLGEGFLNSYLGAPLPSGITFLHPGQCDNSSGAYTATTPNGCDIDVNGDGKATGAFFGTENFAALDKQLQRKRIGINASLQAELGAGFIATSDFFFTNQNRHDRTTGYQLNSATWNGATFLPVTSRNTGAKVYNAGGVFVNDFFTTQRYLTYPGDIETYSENHSTDSTSRNLNLQVAYDNGGNFTGEARGIYASAQELHMQSYVQFAVSDGALWPNEPVGAAPVGTYVYPGGNRVFDPSGFAANTIPMLVDMRGDHLAITLPSALQTTLTNRNAYSLKTIASEGDYDRSAKMNVLRADGHYKFNDKNMRVDFGLRHSNQSGDNTSFALIAPVYGGNGAYNNPLDPITGDELTTKTPNAKGCYVRYKAADILLDGFGINGTCKAGDPVTGFYRAGSISALNPSQVPALLGNSIRLYNHLADVKGVSIYDLDPKIMDDVLAFQNALYPGEVRDIDPGNTWRVDVKQTTGYVQGNYKGEIGLPISANAGAKIVKTNISVNQHKVGAAGPYYTNASDLGVKHTERDFTDVLPALNVALDLRDDLKLRLAYSKNMQLLDLDTWGGGLALEYGLISGSSPQGLLGGSQGGNPDLKPWRSSNYDISLEYYFGRSSMLSIAAFRVNVASFIDNGTTVRCDLPDGDGVVRRCVPISSPIQGSSASLHGWEIGVKQSFDFLSGWIRNFGVDANYTYAPSQVGTDVAGNPIPFPDNSKEQANIIVWYQGKQFQARLAGNYRSKRAVSGNFAGLNGFEEYQASTFYMDASASYDLTHNWQIFAQGSNLTREEEHYYLVWPDQKLNTTRFESRYVTGVRARF